MTVKLYFLNKEWNVRDFSYNVCKNMSFESIQIPADNKGGT